MTDAILDRIVALRQTLGQFETVIRKGDGKVPVFLVMRAALLVDEAANRLGDLVELLQKGSNGKAAKRSRGRDEVGGKSQ